MSHHLAPVAAARLAAAVAATRWGNEIAETNPISLARCDRMHPDASKCNRADVAAENRKTNPPHDFVEALSDRQLAAARLVVRGFSHGKVAREVGVHRCTLTRWRAMGAFDAELRRLRHAAERSAAPLTPSTPSPRPAPPHRLAVRRTPRRSAAADFYNDDPQWNSTVTNLFQALAEAEDGLPPGASYHVPPPRSQP